MKWELPTRFPHAFAHERSHFPGPVRAMDFALNVKAMEWGFNRALAGYRLPLKAIDLHINGFVYEALVSAVLPEEDPGGRGLRPAASSLHIAVDELGRLWSDTWFPALERHLASWAAFDLAGASTAALAEHFAQTRERSRAMWELHFELFFPMLVAISQFQSLCAEVPTGLAPAEVATLLTGIPSKTTQGDDVLWALGRELRQEPRILSILDACACVWAPARTDLLAFAQGRELVERFETYLRDYGQRGSDWSIDRPFWIEDPSPALFALKEYTHAVEGPRVAHRARQEASRVALLAACERRLVAAPHPILPAFRRLLRSARTATWLSEESYHWIEGLGSYSVRKVCLEVGRRLTEAGAMGCPDDVFHLEPEEAREALEALAAGSAPRALDEFERRVASRKLQAARCAGVEPPPVLGVQASLADEPQPPQELGQALDLFFGAPLESSTDDSNLRGHPASPGVARGAVRIVASLDQAGEVRHGDVLVAHTTSPAWTPLFRTISALVTDTGGSLCHAAIVAREYGLPAVVGVGNATRALREGQLVEVDGHEGVVRILEPPPRIAPSEEALTLGSPSALPRDEAALIEQRTPDVARQLEDIAEAILAGRELGYDMSWGPAAASSGETLPKLDAQRVYDMYFHVQRTSSNSLLALAQAARQYNNALVRSKTEQTSEQTAKVQQALADLLCFLRELGLREVGP